MNYEKIMSEKKEYNFPEVYSNAISGILSQGNAGSELQMKLEDKRKLGLAKYGEHSFQGSLQTSLTSPAVEHLKEELYDACNYTAHAIYQSFMFGKDPSYFEELLAKIVSLANEIEDLKEVAP